MSGMSSSDRRQVLAEAAADLRRRADTIANGNTDSTVAKGVRYAAAVLSTAATEPGTSPVCDPGKPNINSPAPHDYEPIGEEEGSLAQGGSYTVLRCKVCNRIAYSPLPD